MFLHSQVLSKSELIKVSVSEVINGSHIYIQNLANGNLLAIENSMVDFGSKVDAGIASTVLEPKRNLLCAIKHKTAAGSVWRRAKILALSKEVRRNKSHYV